MSAQTAATRRAKHYKSWRRQVEPLAFGRVEPTIIVAEAVIIPPRTKREYEEQMAESKAKLALAKEKRDESYDVRGRRHDAHLKRDRGLRDQVKVLDAQIDQLEKHIVWLKGFFPKLQA